MFWGRQRICGQLLYKLEQMIPRGGFQPLPFCEIKEKEKAYRAYHCNWQQLPSERYESSDTNQKSPEIGVSGKRRGKICLFFNRRKKKSIHIAFSLPAADKMPLHKDYILRKPTDWETQTLKISITQAKTGKLPYTFTHLHNRLRNRDQSPLCISHHTEKEKYPVALPQLTHAPKTQL